MEELKIFYRTIFKYIILPITILFFVSLSSLYISSPKIDTNSKTLHSFNADKSPKIIFVGSSNTNFNYNYPKLKKSFAKYSIYSVNKNANQGLCVLFETLDKLSIRDVDVLIIALPYSHYTPKYFLPIGNKYTSYLLNKNIIKDYYNTSFFWYNSHLIFKHVYFHLSNIRKPVDYSILKRNDYLKELPPNNIRKTNDFQWFQSNAKEFSKSYYNFVINKLNTYSKNSFIFYAPVVDNYYNIDENIIYLLNNEPNTLSNFSEAIYDVNYFYDKKYHLNAIGREYHTKRLIDCINQKIKQR